MESREAPRGGGLVAIDGAITLIAILLIVQIWLLSSTLDAFLAGDREAALPGAVLSGAVWAACVGLYLFIERVDAETRTGVE